MKPARCGENGRKMMPGISRHLIWYSAFVFITSAQIESRNPPPSSSTFPSPSHRAINLLSNSCDEVSLTREKRKTNQLKGRELSARRDLGSEACCAKSFTCENPSRPSARANSDEQTFCLLAKKICCTRTKRNENKEVAKAFQLPAIPFFEQKLKKTNIDAKRKHVKEVKHIDFTWRLETRNTCSQVHRSDFHDEEITRTFLHFYAKLEIFERSIS